jgi:hypothetical protein
MIEKVFVARYAFVALIQLLVLSEEGSMLERPFLLHWIRNLILPEDSPLALTLIKKAAKGEAWYNYVMRDRKNSCS